MKIKSLLVTFIVVIIVGHVHANTSFSIPFTDEYNYEPSLEDILKERNPVHLKIPDNMRIVLIMNDLFPWEISNFVHVCIVSHSGARCSYNGYTQFISETFVNMHDVTNTKKRAEIRFNPETGKATKLIMKFGNGKVSRTIGPKIVRI